MITVIKTRLCNTIALLVEVLNHGLNYFFEAFVASLFREFQCGLEILLRRLRTIQDVLRRSSLVVCVGKIGFESNSSIKIVDGSSVLS